MTLEQARKRKGLTQLDMAIRLKKTEKTWRRWERGEGKIPADILPEIQDALGLSDSEILNLFKFQQNHIKEGA
jgi:transcriptional regulator with XRE-family HTH domain